MWFIPRFFVFLQDVRPVHRLLHPPPHVHLILHFNLSIAPSETSNAIIPYNHQSIYLPSRWELVMFCYIFFIVKSISNSIEVSLCWFIYMVYLYITYGCYVWSKIWSDILPFSHDLFSYPIYMEFEIFVILFAVSPLFETIYTFNPFFLINPSNILLWIEV